ncbi:MAG: glucose-1-phosphate adenylyltransferase [Deltaproteobacteria bacterium]|nr:glucose-1-phosphate adenylyltransferase [Deltaproteobacteria bacterium]
MSAEASRLAYRLGRQPKILGVVLAGGEGTRLWPLTADRAKPAVPFGGSYRIIDFVLSNFVNSGIHRIKVLTQYKSDSLLSHISRGWRLSAMLDHHVEPVPAQQRMGKQWFLGSADAIYQSLNVVADEEPDYICVFGGDHIYRMDVRQMLAFHVERDAELTVAAVPVPASEASSFGVIEVDASGRMVGFQEKPRHPKEMPGRPGWVLASMGNYIFDPDVLSDAVTRDAQQDTAHDFGRNILPMLYPSARVYAYNFMENEVPGSEPDERGYWKDVGTIESYFQATLDLVAVKPVLNLYNRRWPIHTWMRPRPPAKFVFADQAQDRMGMATDSLISPGCILSGGRVNRSVLSPFVRVNSYASVDESVLMDDVDVGRHSRLRRTIVDKGVQIPARTEIGFDTDRDRQRFFVSDDGIVVIPKGYRFEG